MFLESRSMQIVHISLYFQVNGIVSSHEVYGNKVRMFAAWL